MTETTEDARRRSREQRRARIAANPDRLCPPNHKHSETSTCFNGHGCRCEACRGARARAKRADYYSLRSITKQDVKVSAVGVQRRLQALAFMGWSCQAVAEMIGSHYRPLVRLRDGGRDHVMRSTHDRIDGVFRELSVTFAPDHSGRVTRGWAKRKGFVSPLAWENIDDPTEQPTGLIVPVRRRVDRELIERLWAEGLSDRVIGERAGCSERTVLRVRQEVGLETRWAA